MNRRAATLIAAAGSLCLWAGLASAADPAPAAPDVSTRSGNGSSSSQSSSGERSSEQSQQRSQSRRDYRSYRGNRDSRNSRDSRNNNGTHTENEQGFSDRYAVVTEQNIFMRDRTRRTRSGPTTQAAPATPEQLLTLTGVVFEDGDYRAYLENLHTGRIDRVSEGDSVARGHISQIDIDAIEYETADGQHTWIEVGSDLTGKAPTVASATDDSDSGPKLDPNDPNLTPEQRLKARRQQLLGK